MDSSLLLVHLDRAMKTERAAVVDRIERMTLEVSRANAVAQAAEQKIEIAEARASRAADAELEAEARRQAAEQRLSAQESAARAADARAHAAESALASARETVTRDATPEAALRRTCADLERAADKMDDESLASLTELAQSIVDVLLATKRKREPPPVAPTVSPETLVVAAPNDEMEKLLQKYDAAKARLLALEEIYPGRV